MQAGVAHVIPLAPPYANNIKKYNISMFAKNYSCEDVFKL